MKHTQHPWRRLLVSLSPCLLVSFCSAAPVQGLLTLDRAVETALRQSPVVRGAVVEVEIAVQELQAVRAQRRPILSTTAFLSGGSMGSIAATPAPVMPSMVLAVPRGAFYDQNVSLMAPLSTGGRLEALVRRADAARKASSADLDEVRLEVALMTRSAYRTAQARRAFMGLYQELVRTGEERLRVSTIAFREGRLPRYPVLRDEAEVANATQQLTNLQRDYEMALVELRTVIGVGFAADVRLEDPPPFQPVTALLAALPVVGLAEDERPPILDRLLALAEQRRPLLAAQRLRREAAGLDVKVARAAYRPQVSLFAMADAMQGKEMDPFRGYTAGIAVALPLLDGGMRRAEVKKAGAAQRRQDLDLERLALQVTRDVTNAWLALRAAEQNVTTAQSGIRAADEDYRVAQLRYQEGKSINVEALDALAARTRAHANLHQALFDYQIAADQLRRAVGVPW